MEFDQFKMRYERGFIEVREECGLIVAFVRNGNVGSVSKKELLECWDRINQACNVVNTRCKAEDELFGQAAWCLGLLAEKCEAFGEFFEILQKADYRLQQSVCSIRISQLIKLGGKIAR